MYGLTRNMNLREKNFYQQIEIFLLVINAMFQVNLLEISMQVNGKNYMKKWLNKIDRLAQDSLDRSKYLRLDKNERVIQFEKRFLEYLKKKIDSFNLSAYPNTLRIKKNCKKIKSKRCNDFYVSRI